MRKFLGDYIRATYEKHKEQLANQRLGDPPIKRDSDNPRPKAFMMEVLERTYEEVAASTYEVADEALPGDHMSLETIRAIIARRPPWDGSVLRSDVPPDETQEAKAASSVPEVSEHSDGQGADQNEREP
jgi:hypothetical protein